MDNPPPTGHYEYSKPVWFSNSQAEADELSSSTETPVIEVEEELVCDDICDTCVTEALNCLTCSANRAGPPLCYCEAGFFEEEDGFCTACASKCNTCEDQADNCLTCDAEREGEPACLCPDG